MTWREWQAARQHLAEERIGTALRAAEAVENNEFRSAASRLSK